MVYLCAIKRRKASQLKSAIMATYYRVDEWNSKGNYSDTHFEPSLSDAMEWAHGMTIVSPKETEGVEHTAIQEFDALTCDMEGWNNSNAELTTPINFIFK